MKTLIIYAKDGKTEEREGKLSLEEAQKVVGGYVEVVRLPATKDTAPRQMLVNEEPFRLPKMFLNVEATRLYQASTGKFGSKIYGDVAICIGWRFD